MGKIIGRRETNDILGKRVSCVDQKRVGMTTPKNEKCIEKDCVGEIIGRREPDEIELGNPANHVEKNVWRVIGRREPNESQLGNHISFVEETHVEK